MSTASTRTTSGNRWRTAVAATSAAALVTGLAVAGAAPAQSIGRAAIDPACVYVAPPASTPVLTDLAISPAAVDVRTGARSVVITAHAQDTVPVVSVDVYLTSGGKGRAGTALVAELERVGGTALDGTWSATLVVPRWVADGSYRVRVALTDSGAHRSQYTPTAPGWGAWPTSLTVRSVADVTPPRLRGFSASTSAVNTSAKAKKVRFRVVMTDAQSGVRDVSVSVVRDWNRARFFSTALKRSAAGSNVWVGSVTVPRWQGAGTHAWKLRVDASDRIGHRRTWTRTDLAAQGWRSSVRVTSRTDTTKPAIAAVSLSPTSVDARSGDTRLSFSVRVTDPQSGVGGMRFNFLRLPVAITSVTGGIHDRTYTGFVLVPQCGASGTYPVTIEAVDVWGVEHPLAPLALRHVARTTRSVSVLQLDAGP
jgi:hypothetical protein